MNELLVLFLLLIAAVALVYLAFYGLEHARLPDPVANVARWLVGGFVVVLCLLALVEVFRRAGLLSGL